MKNFLKILSTGAILGMGLSSSAQDLHFSQFYENSILRNPALTGIFSGDYKVGIDYRNQWASVTNPYQTAMVTGETRILVNRNTNDYMSFGIVGTYDKAGTIEMTSQEIMPSLAFNKSLGDAHNTYLSIGVSGGYIARYVDMSKMTFSSQYQNGGYNSANPTGENTPFKSLSTYDLAAGLSLNGSLDQNNRANYYIGGSLSHLNHPTEVFASSTGDATTALPMKLQINAGLNLVFNETFSLALHGNYSREQPANETIYGGLLTWHSFVPGVSSPFSFSFGAFYRYQDAIIPTVRLEYENVSFTFSYDVTNSSLASTGGQGAGGTEISLFVRGHYAHRNNPRDNVACPRFDDDVLYPFLFSSTAEA